MVFLRRALVTVPLVLLLGIASGAIAGSGQGNAWFAALRKPGLTPPGWAFPVAWTILYAMQGLALAIVVQARGARGRPAAIIAFAVQLALNLAWAPLFFAGHQVHAAFWLIVAIFVAALAATVLFGRIRSSAGLLMLPYLGWLLFAGALDLAIDRMNPDAATLAPPSSTTQISL